MKPSSGQLNDSGQRKANKWLKSDSVAAADYDDDDDDQDHDDNISTLRENQSAFIWLKLNQSSASSKLNKSPVSADEANTNAQNQSDAEVCLLLVPNNNNNRRPKTTCCSSANCL